MNYEKLDSFAPDLQSASPIEGNLAALQQLFPSVVREGKVDFDALRQLLGDDVAKSDELFGLQWHGKARARRHALMPSLGTLRPCREESKNWDSTQNLYIEGDNLEVLKLLQKSYAGKVKVIYIDPPYNTGGEFVYPDDYQNGINNYLELTGQQDKFKANTETSGRYHTAWLNMMYPRLMLAKHLLADDGLIIISISEDELSNLKSICDEIFGEDMLLSIFLWKKKGTTSNVENAECSSLTDYQLCYRATTTTKFRPRIKKAESRTYPHHDKEGNFRTKIIEKKDSGAYKRDSMKYEILGHKPRTGKRWQIGIERARELESQSRLIWDGEKIVQKVYDFEDCDTFSAHPNLLDFLGTTDEAARSVNSELFGISELFDNPKPTGLVKFFIQHALNEQSLILDFFSGSATTAHAVMQLNAEDGGKRRYIMVQLPEPCVEGSEAAKAGYANICEIGKERIRRAGEKVKAEAGEAGKDMDIGFRVFKLDSSNVQPWNPEAGMLNLQLESESNLRPERSSDDIFYEVLLKQGIELTEDSRSKEIAGHVVYSLGHGQYYCCFDESIGEEAQELAAGIALWHEEEDADGQNCVVYVRDSAFDAGGIWTGGTSNNSDARKTSFCLTLEQSGIMKVKGI